jgi:succinate dehydrogenase / fumarate reductase flavoprotein subunit
MMEGSGYPGTRATIDHPTKYPRKTATIISSEKYPAYGNLAPRDISSRAAKEVCDEGRGVGPGGRGVYLDFRDAIQRLGLNVVRERYGNLFEMYERITGKMLIRLRCAFIPRAITRWAASGWTIT